MASPIWLFTFNIKKANGEPFPAPQEMHRLNEAAVPGELKKVAEKIAERFDFPYVEALAKNTETGKVYRFKHIAEEGFRDEWQVGRQ